MVLLTRAKDGWVVYGLARSIGASASSMRLLSRILRWAILDSNQGPLPYQRSALTN